MSSIINFDELESSDAPFYLKILKGLSKKSGKGHSKHDQIKFKNELFSQKKIILNGTIYYPLPFVEFAQMLILQINAMHQIADRKSEKESKKIKELNSLLFNQFLKETSKKTKEMYRLKYPRDPSKPQKPKRRKSTLERIHSIARRQHKLIYGANPSLKKGDLNFKEVWKKTESNYQNALNQLYKIQDNHNIKVQQVQGEVQEILIRRKPIALQATLHFRGRYAITYVDPRPKDQTTFSTPHSRAYAKTNDREQLGDVPNFRKISVYNESGKEIFSYYRHTSLPIYQRYNFNENESAFIYRSLIDSMKKKISLIEPNQTNKIYENMVHVISPSQTPDPAPGFKWLEPHFKLFEKIDYKDKTKFNFENSWLIHEMFRGYQINTKIYEPNYMAFGINIQKGLLTELQKKVNEQAIYHMRLQLIDRLGMDLRQDFDEIKNFLTLKNASQQYKSKIKEIRKNLSKINQNISELRSALLEHRNISDDDFLKARQKLNESIRKRQEYELSLQEIYRNQTNFNQGEKLIRLIAKLNHIQNPNDHEKKALELLKMYADIERFYYTGDWCKYGFMEKPYHQWKKYWAKEWLQAGKMQALILNFSHQANIVATTGCKSTADRGPAQGRQAVYLAIHHQEGYKPFYRINDQGEISYHEQFGEDYETQFLEDYYRTNLDTLTHAHNQGPSGGKHDSDTDATKECVRLREPAKTRYQSARSYAKDLVKHAQRLRAKQNDTVQVSPSNSPLPKTQRSTTHANHLHLSPPPRNRSSSHKIQRRKPS